MCRNPVWGNVWCNDEHPYGQVGLAIVRAGSEVLKDSLIRGDRCVLGCSEEMR